MATCPSLPPMLHAQAFPSVHFLPDPSDFSETPPFLWGSTTCPLWGLWVSSQGPHTIDTAAPHFPSLPRLPVLSLKSPWPFGSDPSPRLSLPLSLQGPTPSKTSSYLCVVSTSPYVSCAPCLVSSPSRTLETGSASRGRAVSAPRADPCPAAGLQDSAQAAAPLPLAAWRPAWWWQPQPHPGPGQVCLGRAPSCPGPAGGGGWSGASTLLGPGGRCDSPGGSEQSFRVPGRLPGSAPVAGGGRGTAWGQRGWRAQPWAFPCKKSRTLRGQPSSSCTARLPSPLTPTIIA